MLGFVGAIMVGLTQSLIGTFVRKRRPELYRSWSGPIGLAWRMLVVASVGCLVGLGLIVAGLNTAGSSNRSGFFVFAGIVFLGAAVAGLASVQQFRRSRYGG